MTDDRIKALADALTRARDRGVVVTIYPDGLVTCTDGKVGSDIATALYHLVHDKENATVTVHASVIA